MIDDVGSFAKPAEKFAMPSDVMVPPAPWVKINRTGPVPDLLHGVSFESIDTINGIGSATSAIFEYRLAYALPNFVVL